MEIKEGTMEQANQLMYDAIKRWQAARKDIFTYDNRDANFEERKKLWDELSNAEHDLMSV